MHRAPVPETPLTPVRLECVSGSFEILLKLEGYNKYGSIKDRPARNMLAVLEREGRLGPDSTIVESSSGNLAVALAAACRDRGIRFIAVVDPKTTPENVERIRGYGGIIHLVDEPDASGGYLLTRLAAVKAYLDEDPSFIWTNQYENAANPEAHRTGTAVEIFRQAGRRVGSLFTSISTGGTLAGVSRFFRETSPETRIVAVDAAGSVALGGEPKPRKLTGIGSSRRSLFVKPSDYDDCIYVTDAEAFWACNALHQQTGLHVGGSSGASIAACAKALIAEPDLPGPIVTICSDRGENYASTIYDRDWLASVGYEPPLLADQVKSLQKVRALEPA